MYIFLHFFFLLLLFCQGQTAHQLFLRECIKIKRAYKKALADRCETNTPRRESNVYITIIYYIFFPLAKIKRLLFALVISRIKLVKALRHLRMRARRGWERREQTLSHTYTHTSEGKRERESSSTTYASDIGRVTRIKGRGVAGESGGKIEKSRASNRW